MRQFNSSPVEVRRMVGRGARGLQRIRFEHNQMAKLVEAIPLKTFDWQQNFMAMKYMGIHTNSPTLGILS